MFLEELAAVLPADLPRRDDVITKAAKHLELIVEANQYFNLTRITGPRDAAIKHVFDSARPWRLFSEAKHVLDAGTGAGFPGIPLALIFPETRFTLSESIHKKARFVDSAVNALELPNVEVTAQRAEHVFRGKHIDVITARAMAPISRALELFSPALKAGARALLYKGPDACTEISNAAIQARKQQIRIRVVDQYELPDSLGTRTIVEMSS